MSSAHSKSGGYEKSDAKPKVVIYFLLILGVLIAVSLGAMGLLLKGMQGVEAKIDKPQYFVQDDRWEAPGVTLETHPSELRENLNKAEQEILTTYGWTDPANGRVRVPIERAKALALKRGFPDEKAVSDEREIVKAVAAASPETAEQVHDATQDLSDEQKKKTT